MHVTHQRSRRAPGFFAALAVAAPGPWSPATGQAEHRFWDLGDLPGGASISYTYGLSPRGDVIAGESYSADSSVHGEGVRWSRVSPTQWEMTGIGFPSSDALNTPALGISANGHWLVGRVSFEPPTAPAIDTDAYRWSETTGFERLGLPAGFIFASALGANGNGDVIVGYGGPHAGYVDLRALVWTRAGPGFEVSYLETEYHSQATRLDRDGRTAVGWGASPAAVAAAGGNWDPREAALWRRDADGGVQRMWLGASSGTVFQSQALGLRRVRSRPVAGGASGGFLAGLQPAPLKTKTVVVGVSGDFNLEMEPVVWTVVGSDPATIEVLPILPGFTSGSAYALSSNARRILGTCWDGDFVFETCVWDLDTATDTYVVSSLQARLAANGVTEAVGWMLWGAAGISDDGTILCGSGYDPNFEERGWAAELP